MVSLPNVPNLTQEQLDILETCPNPDKVSKGQLVRITAAAGAGKTTTLLALAVKAVQLGHTHIAYVTFTKAAAKDGKERLQKVVSQPNVLIDAQTLHSCALRSLKSHLSNGVEDKEVNSKMWSDKRIKRWVSEKCAKEVTQFLSRLDRGKGHSHERERIAREYVEFYIYKSLVHFCRSEWTLRQYMQENPFGRDYFPAKKFHSPGQRGEKYGFDLRHYGRRVSFYGDQAGRLFEIALQGDIRCFDFIMKRAQLLRLRVPGTLLLVDESQDMDACQVDWIAKQQIMMGSHIYVVGDPAQAIYGFRGAKPRFLMGLRSDIDMMLTESWRFGVSISKIANLVLFAKEKSDQTEVTYDGRYKHWIPYRTKPGILEKESRVTTKSLIDGWHDSKVTVIARQNASLLLVALEALGFVFADGVSDESEQENHDNRDHGRPIGEEQHDPRLVVVTPDSEDEDNVGTDEGPTAYPEELPKMHINGCGEGSGIGLWRKSLKLVAAVYELYSAENGSRKQLDPLLFPEFINKQVSWHSFYEECTEKEMTQYHNVINVVIKCKDRTMEAIELFRRHVMERHFTAEEADIILTTCHSAKGMEWENVQVYDDFESLCTFKKNPVALQESASVIQDDDASDPSPSKKKRINDSFQFGFPGWGDDLNLAYVACTRAKKVLSVPPCIYDVLLTLDEVYKWHRERGEGVRNATLLVNGYRNPLTENDVENFNRCLVYPLRGECDVVGTDLLAPALVEFGDTEEGQHGVQPAEPP